MVRNCAGGGSLGPRAAEVDEAGPVWWGRSSFSGVAEGVVRCAGVVVAVARRGRRLVVGDGCFRWVSR